MRCTFFFDTLNWKGVYFFVMVSPAEKSEYVYILNELPGVLFFAAFSVLVMQWYAQRNAVKRRAPLHLLLLAPRATLRMDTHFRAERQLHHFTSRARPALLGANVAVFLLQVVVWILYLNTPHVDSTVWTLVSAFLHAAAFIAVTAWLLVYGVAAVHLVQRTTVRLALRQRKLREVQLTLGVSAALLCLRVAVLAVAAGLSVAHPDLLDRQVDTVEAAVMASYYLLTEVAPIALLLVYQRHLPPTAPAQTAAGGYQVLKGRADHQLISPDTSAALRPSFNPDHFLLSTPARSKRPAQETLLSPGATTPSYGSTSSTPRAIPPRGVEPRTPPPPSPRSTPSSFVADSAAMGSAETTRAVRMFGNVPTATHVSSSSGRLSMTVHEGGGQARGRLDRPRSGSGALPSVAAALASRDSDLSDAFSPSRTVSWTASGRVLLSWKDAPAQHPRRDWRAGGWLGSAIASTLSAAFQPAAPAAHIRQGSGTINSPPVPRAASDPVPIGGAGRLAARSPALAAVHVQSGRAPRLGAGAPNTPASVTGVSLQDITSMRDRAAAHESGAAGV